MTPESFVPDQAEVGVHALLLLAGALFIVGLFAYFLSRRKGRDPDYFDSLRPSTFEEEQHAFDRILADCRAKDWSERSWLWPERLQILAGRAALAAAIRRARSK